MTANGVVAIDRAVSALTGVATDATSEVGPAIITDVVNNIGGVRACLPGDVPSRRPGLVYPKGCRDFDGAAAADIAFAPDSAATAQRLMMGFMQKAVALDEAKLASLLFGKGVRVDTKGRGVSELAAVLRGIKPSDVVGLVPPAGARDMAEVFAALRQDTVAGFTAAHPDWVTPAS